MDKKDHKAGGGTKKIITHKLNFSEKAQSKIGSKDNIKHKAGGGDVEVWSVKFTLHRLCSMHMLIKLRSCLNLLIILIHLLANEDKMYTAVFRAKF